MVSYEHKVKNIYLGEPWWEPGADTVFYIKWEWDIKDYWPNNYQFTNNLVTVEDTYLSFPWTSQNRLVNSTATIPQTYTFSAWLYITWPWWSYSPRIMESATTDSFIAYRWSGWTLYKLTYNWSIDNWPILPTNTRFNIVVTRVQWWKTTVYINATQTAQENSATINYGTWVILWCKHASSRDSYQGRMAKIILEDKAWTDQEIANYYDQTKSDYGL